LPSGRFRAPVRSASVARAARPPADDLLRHQVVSYGVIGVLSLLAYLGAFHLLSGVLPAVPANVVAVVLVAWANTAANRVFTFFQATRERYLRHQVESALTFGLALVLSSVALALLHRAVAAPDPRVELAVVAGGNLLGAALRFVLLRAWVFNPRRNPRRGDDDLVGAGG
ncbi:MAG TPA: GtrA family protein, partial [Thermomonospora sp.]|nr:GtrA family protein [Thermomonospora sp.]